MSRRPTVRGRRRYSVWSAILISFCAPFLILLRLRRSRNDARLSAHVWHGFATHHFRALRGAPIGGRLCVLSSNLTRLFLDNKYRCECRIQSFDVLSVYRKSASKRAISTDSLKGL